MKQRTANAPRVHSAVISIVLLIIAGVVNGQRSSPNPTPSVAPSSQPSIPSPPSNVSTHSGVVAASPPLGLAGVKPFDIGFFVGLAALILGVAHLFLLHAQARESRSQAADLRSQAQLSESHKKSLDAILDSQARQTAITEGHSKTLEAILETQSRQAAITEGHSKTLEAILDTQSTHHIGQFPEYIISIAERIEAATKEIEILCDFPGYGSFSAPHDYLRYRQAIERKIDEGIPVKITCLNLKARADLINEQFSKEDSEWAELKNKNYDRMEIFLRRHGGESMVEALSVQEFVSLLVEDLRVRDADFDGAELSMIGEYIPLYFWLVDGISAVFAIPSFSERGTEHGFSTLDPRLIAAFQDLRARYQRESLHEESPIQSRCTS